MSDFRDIQHGVNDPVDGLDVKRQINDNRTPHERAQRHADVYVPRRPPRRPSRFCPNGFGANRPIRSIHGPGGDRRINR